MKLDRERIAALGLDLKTVTDWVGAANGGVMVSTSKLGPKAILVRVGDSDDELLAMPIAAGDQVIRLDSIVNLTMTPKFTRRLRFGG